MRLSPKRADDGQIEGGLDFRAAVGALGSHGLHQGLRSVDLHSALQVVSQHTQAHLRSKPALQPSISLEAGLRATIAWYLERADALETGWQRTIAA